MSWSEAIANLRETVRTMIDQRLANFVGWTRVMISSSLGDKDAVETGDGDGSQRPVQRLEPWGLRSVPVSKSRGFWIRLGSSNVFFVGLLPTSGYGPTDLEEGETSLYCLSEGARVKLDKDGGAQIDSTVGQIVNVQNGTDGIARLNDTVDWNNPWFVWAVAVGIATGIAAPLNPTIGTISSASTKANCG